MREEVESRTDLFRELQEQGSCEAGNTLEHWMAYVGSEDIQLEYCATKSKSARCTTHIYITFEGSKGIPVLPIHTKKATVISKNPTPNEGTKGE